MKHLELAASQNLKLMENPQGKAVRFSQLVASFGKPEVVTLWTDPKKDPSFLNLVKKQRVVTIIQKPAGGKKDFGYIGFHPQRFAVFMVFPEALGPDDGVRIIGIKYDLLKSAGPQKGFHPKMVGAPKPAAKKPLEKFFNARILRTLSQELEFAVKGRNMTDAKAKAMAAASGHGLPSQTKKVSDQVIEIKESL